MRDLGWTYEENRHLFLVSMDEYKLTEIIRVPIFDNKLDQITALKSVVVINNTLKQSKRIFKKTEIVKKANTPCGGIKKSQYKMIQRKGGLLKFEKSINSRTTLTNYKIGDIFGLSKRTGSRLQVRMNKLGLIKSEACYQRANIDSFEKPKNAFMYRNLYFAVRMANTITSLHLLS